MWLILAGIGVGLALGCGWIILKVVLGLLMLPFQEDDSRPKKYPPRNPLSTTTLERPIPKATKKLMEKMRHRAKKEEIARQKRLETCKPVNSQKEKTEHLVDEHTLPLVIIITIAIGALILILSLN